MTADDPRVLALVEQILESHVSPEEACRDTPELLPAVRDRLKRFRVMEAQVAEVFPSRQGAAGDAAAKARKPPPIPDIPGYEVQEVVGAGGIGVVYKARHKRLNRIVAVKMLLAGGYAGRRDIERFKREAEAVAALRHPNIVPVYDAGDHDGFPYFTMEFMEAGSLSRALRGTPLPAKNAAESIAILARAIEAAHQSGIVHRDLKPGNVLIAADGTLKIADYGLAWRREGSDSNITLDSEQLGTPSYMSPEQAIGPASGPAAHSPAVDIYGLGTILYEMLTGRPPFRGESTMETQRQVISDEPIPPGKLNPRCPRDLQTICLKCLQKAPGHRYESAGALADDIDRFLRNEPIAARPVSSFERGVRWARRKPAVAALIVTVLALIALGIAFAANSWRLETKHRADVTRWETSLDIANQFQIDGKFHEARALLEGLPEEARSEFRDRVRSAFAGLGLVQELDQIRNDRVALVDGRYDLIAARLQADPKYEAAIAEAGVGHPADDPVQVANRMRVLPIRRALVAAMDDWAICTRDQLRRSWIFEVARRADPDPSGWRDRVRDPTLSKETLLALADSAAVKNHSPQLLVSLAQRIQDARADAASFLGRVVQQYPVDFWANYVLGQELYTKKPEDAIRYFQVALAMHPEQPSLYYTLAGPLAMNGQLKEAVKNQEQAFRLEKRFARAMGACAELYAQLGKDKEAFDLVRQALAIDDRCAELFLSAGAVYDKVGKGPEALEAWRRAAELGPQLSRPHLLMASSFASSNRLEEARKEIERARAIDPNDSALHLGLGRLLKREDRIDDAIPEFEAQLRINDRYLRFLTHLELGNCWRLKQSPPSALLEYNKAAELYLEMSDAVQPRRCVLVQLGMGEEVRKEWRKTLTPDSDQPAWGGYVELCLYLGHQDEYERGCHDLLDRFWTCYDAMICERVGKACLLGNLGPEDGARALQMIDRAMDGSPPPWLRPYLQVAQGLASYRRNDFDEAVATLRENTPDVLGPLPHLVLAMAQSRAGATGDALRRYAAALRMYDWSPSRVQDHDAWSCHILRREAEPLIMPNLKALLAGREKPRDQDERLALSAVCGSVDRTATAASFYADALAAEPDLASRLDTGLRYAAACCAARAGCGSGEDAKLLDEAERARWRGQARLWLRADLDSWKGTPAEKPRGDLMRRTLTRWRADPDLAGLRDPESLAKLPQAERDECLAIWSDVDAVLGRAPESR